MRSITPVEKLIGPRIRQLRIQLGMPQEELAVALGISFQQIQKYEKSLNRLSVGRLMEMARALKTDPHDLMGWTETAPSAKQLAAANNVNPYNAQLYKLALSLEGLPNNLFNPIRSLIEAIKRDDDE